MDNHTFPVCDPKITIDYIFAKKSENFDFTVKNRVVVDEKIASDHLPLYVDVCCKKR